MKYRRKSFIFGLIGFILAFPVFLTQNFSVFQGDSFSGEFAIPFSFVFVFFLGLFLFFTSGKIPRIFFILNILALVGFFLIFQSGWFDGVALYVLYLVPMIFSTFSGYSLAPDEKSVLQFQRWFGLSAAFSAILYISSSVMDFGWIGAFSYRGTDSIFGIFSIYQKFIYYATILAIGFLFLLKSERGWVRFVSCTFLLLGILITGSREALVLVAFFLICHLVGNGKWRAANFSFFLLAIFGLVSVFVLCLFFYDFEFDVNRLTFLAKILSLFDPEGGGGSAGRFETIKYIYNLVEFDYWFLFFGTFFESSLIGFGAPHNQYLEWHFRGGILFFVLNIGILAYAIFVVKKMRQYYSVGALYLLLIAMVLISNNINTPFRAPYTSTVIFFVVGIVFFLKKNSGICK